MYVTDYKSSDLHLLNSDVTNKYFTHSINHNMPLPCDIIQLTSCVSHVVKNYISDSFYINYVK